MPQDGLGVRIALVKLLFPPGEKKGANDTLELRCSSLSFMEVERHTALLWGAKDRGGDSQCHPTTQLNKKEGGGGAVAIAVIIITKYNIKQLVRRQREKGSAHPPPCASAMKTLVKDTRTGLKTAPFQCQRRWEGLMRGLVKELMAGWGSRARGGRAGCLAAIVSRQRKQTWRQSCGKRGAIRNWRDSVFLEL